MAIAVVAIGFVISSLILAACGFSSNDVATLRTAGDTHAESPSAEADPVLDNEAQMMAFTECLRKQGIDVLDPVVDADGNVQKPEFAGDIDAKREDLGETWEACAEHLEGFIFEKERVDVSEVVDQYVALATCLREKGHDVDDPTAESLDQWWVDVKSIMDWDDPQTQTDYEECSGETVGGNGGK